MTEPATCLQDAVDRNAPAALSVGPAGRTRPARSRFLAFAVAGPDVGVWAALPSGQADAIDAMIRTGDAVRVNFKHERTHLEFTARVLERRRAYPLNASTTVEAVRLAPPVGLNVLQRRAAYRVGVSRHDGVGLRFWRIEQADALESVPPATAEMTLDVHDLSAAGAGGVWKRRRGEPSVLGRDQRLRVEVALDGESALLDAYVRYVAGLPEPEYRRIGVQFMVNPTSAADRAKTALLHKITAELERAELKRMSATR